MKGTREDSKMERTDWVYRDDFGNEQGPYDPAEILSWVVEGYFDGRGDVKFKRTGSTTWERLDKLLPELLSHQQAIALQRLQYEESSDQPRSSSSQSTIEEDAPIPMPSSLEGLGDRSLFKSLHTCDVDIFIHPEEKAQRALWKAPMKIIKIPAHASLLKVASPVFLKTLEALEKKNRYIEDEKQRIRLDIVASNPEAIRVIIRWIYGLRFETVNVEPLLLLSVMRESRRLNISKLAQQCREMLARPMDIESLVQIAIACEAIKLPELLEETVQLLADCAYAVFSSSRYLTLPAVTFCKLLQSDHTMIDEFQLFMCAQAYIAEHEASIGIFSKTAEKGKTEESKRAAETKLLSFIRFDSMSSRQINEIRVGTKWDSLLLDACLRKLLNKEGCPRLAPWTENEEFTLEFCDTRYPIILKRLARTKQLDTWAWTAGHCRPVSEALWSLEIVRTKRGCVSIGVAMSQTEAMQPRSHIKIPTGTDYLWYFNCDSAQFFTGQIGANPAFVGQRCLFSAEKCSTWKRRLRNGDVVAVRVSIIINAVHLSVYVIGEHDRCRATWSFPHHCQQSIKGVGTGRPFLLMKPWLECLHDGDTFKVPQLVAGYSKME